MKIPFGYGNCKITFLAGSQPDGRSVILEFKIDQSSFYEIDEWSEEWTSLARSREKDIYGYHFSFDLRLLDNSLQSASTQNTLINFLYHYNLNIYDDKRFLIKPYRSSTNEYLEFSQFTVTAMGYPKLSNVAETSRSKGQYLHLKCKSKFITRAAIYDSLIYRETSDDSWGILPVVTNTGRSSSGNPTNVGMPMIQKISAANDASFKDGTIGNWVVYSDGNGTCTYDGVNPTAEKVSKVLVGATPGTYTGMDLPTGSISAFVNTKTYKIRARIYIPSGNNNWTKIAILPVDLAGWTKLSEVIATLTTEDGWQTIEAVYTAAADITGNITIKGESTTAGDIFYADDIEIFKD